MPVLSFLLRFYVRLLLFGLALVLGMQVPGFVDQYRARVDAHYREVSANIAGFQRTADILFSGNLRALLTYYERSGDEVFRRDAQSIRVIVDRYERFQVEQQILSGTELSVLWHVLFNADQEIFEETLQQYNYSIPLSESALFWGAGVALLLVLGLDLGWFGCISCVRYIRRRRQLREKIGIETVQSKIGNGQSS